MAAFTELLVTRKKVVLNKKYDIDPELSECQATLPYMAMPLLRLLMLVDTLVPAVIFLTVLTIARGNYVSAALIKRCTTLPPQSSDPAWSFPVRKLHSRSEGNTVAPSLEFQLPYSIPLEDVGSFQLGLKIEVDNQVMTLALSSSDEGIRLFSDDTESCGRAGKIYIAEKTGDTPKNSLGQPAHAKS